MQILSRTSNIRIAIGNGFISNSNRPLFKEKCHYINVHEYGCVGILHKFFSISVISSIKVVDSNQSKNIVSY